MNNRKIELAMKIKYNSTERFQEQWFKQILIFFYISISFIYFLILSISEDKSAGQLSCGKAECRHGSPTPGPPSTYHGRECAGHSRRTQAETHRSGGLRVDAKSQETGQQGLHLKYRDQPIRELPYREAARITWNRKRQGWVILQVAVMYVY